MSVITPKAAAQAAIDIVNHSLAQDPTRLRFWTAGVQVDGEAAEVSVVVMSGADRAKLVALVEGGLFDMINFGPSDASAPGGDEPPVAVPDVEADAAPNA